MKYVLINITKFILAGITSIIILSILCFTYYKIPIHIENPNRNTDFVWQKNSLWIKLTEGFSYGRFDDNGYNNLKVIDNPDIIILGSSHTIGTQVKQTETFSSLLGQKLEGKYTVYNMGMDNHTIYKNSSNLKRNLELYDKPPKYIIIETANIWLSEEETNKIINDNYPLIESYSNGLIGKLQQIPFFRLMYFQYTHGLLDKFKNSIETKNNDTIDIQDNINIIDKKYYDDLFNFYNSLEKEYNTQIIIVYHPILEMNEDGSVSPETNMKDLEYFKYYSNKYDISFIDMTDSFTKMYQNEKHLPHGFFTGEIGYGHLNKYGHQKISEKLYETIISMEEDGLL